METSVELITPEVAKKLLTSNTSNRKAGMKTVKRYAAAMTAGDWETTHQGIAIGINGNLLDGQHRLMAIVMSGVSVNMLVSRNVPEHQFYIFDAGYGRTDAQNLGLDKRMIEVVKLVIDVAKLGKENFGYTPSELVSVAELYSDHHKSLLTSSKSTTRIFGSCPVRAAACTAMILSDVPHDVIVGRYSDLIHYNADRFTPAMVSFARLVANGTIQSSGGAAGRKELMSRVYPIFSTDANQIILRYSPSSLSNLHVKLKNLMKGRINQ